MLCRGLPLRDRFKAALRRMLRGIRNTAEHAGGRSGAGAWTLLFPLTYALRSRVTGASLSEAEFA